MDGAVLTATKDSIEKCSSTPANNAEARAIGIRLINFWNSPERLASVFNFFNRLTILAIILMTISFYSAEIKSLDSVKINNGSVFISWISPCPLLLNPCDDNGVKLSVFSKGKSQAPVNEIFISEKLNNEKSPLIVSRQLPCDTA